MLKVLHGTPKSLVLIFMLFSTAAFSKSTSNHFNRSLPNTVITNLSITAPADITVFTDMFSRNAMVGYLGTPAYSGAVASVSNDAPSAFPIGATTVTWTAKDADGNAVTDTQTVTVVDNEKPYIQQLFEIAVVSDDGKCEAVVTLYIPEIYDNSGVATLTHNAPAVFPVGTTLIIWTVTDGSGNYDTMTQKVTVIDNELPVVHILNPLIQVSSSAQQCGAVVDLGTPSVSDNCGIASITNDAPAVFPVGTTIVTWTVIDLGGYEVRKTQSVTVTDTQNPTVTAPAAITVSNQPGKNGAVVNTGNPVAGDNCGISSVSSNAPSFFLIGTTTITWTVTDMNGNAVTATQQVTVLDTEKPVLSGIPGNVTVSCDNVPQPAAVSATDNSGTAQVTLQQSSTKGSNSNYSSFYNYIITRTWTATDNRGNTATAKQVITVNDKNSPVINAPNITVGNDVNKCAAIVQYPVTITDNSGGPLTISYSKSPGSSFSTGTTTVTVTARDISGNSSSRSFIVTVNDTQKPSVTAPNNVSASTSGNSISSSSVKLGTPTTADNCGVKTISNNAPSSYPVGTTQVTWTVRDNAGNTSTAVQTVTVSRRRTNATETVQGSGFAEEEETGLSVKIGGNPARTYFTLYLQSRESTPVNIRVSDMNGRIVESRAGVGGNSTVQIGHSYHSGTYFAEIVQGRQRKTIQLIKIQ
jgi:hypothetical protein